MKRVMTEREPVLRRIASRAWQGSSFVSAMMTLTGALMLVISVVGGKLVGLTALALLAGGLALLAICLVFTDTGGEP